MMGSPVPDGVPHFMCVTPCAALHRVRQGLITFPQFVEHASIF